MTKRFAAAALWFIAGLYVGTTLAFVFHLSPVLGPAVAALGAIIMAGDPQHLIWDRQSR